MEQTVDPRRVLDLAEGMSRLNRIMESAQGRVDRDTGGLIGETRHQYPEPYVQSAAHAADAVLREIKALAASLSDQMGKKVEALTWAAEEYRKAEEKAKLKLVKDIRKRYEQLWSGHQKVGVGLYSWYKGYKFQIKGNYIHVYGAKKASGFWDNAYLKMRQSDKLMGTRYRIDNPAFAKYLKPSVAVKSALNDSYNVMNPKAWKNTVKGGGLLTPIFTVGGSVYSYGWGEHRADGIASTEFASDLIVESSVAVATTALSTAAGVGAVAAAGAAFGSVVPGLGTAVGFVVGVGVGIALSSDTGQKALNWTKGKVNDALESGKDAAEEAAGKLGKAASRVIGGVRSWF